MNSREQAGKKARERKSNSSSNSRLVEEVFLKLAQKWNAEVEKSSPGKPLSEHCDELALACLLLAIEWGEGFSSETGNQILANRQAAEDYRDIAWIDRIPWDVCYTAAFNRSKNRMEINELVANLDHHNSSIRYWMMNIAWFAAPVLNPVESLVRLLNNLANTLGHPLMAAAVAVRFLGSEEGFFNFARNHIPPAGFEEQYKSRLEYLEKHGVLSVQAPLWQLESGCRKRITETAF